MAPDPVPLLYRLTLLYIEPICALNGAYLLLRSPSRFLNAVSPNHPLPSSSPSSSCSNVSSFSSSASTLPSDDGTTTSSSATADPLASVRILTDMLGIMQLVFAFNLAVVLRVARRDARLWRCMCAGMLLSDALHILASVREYGGWRSSADVSAWRVDDWLNFGILWAMGLVRAGVVLGVGMRNGTAATGAVATDVTRVKSS
ncbi:hypothetical protein ACO1O0_009374 [Amphichorda felina]